MIWDKYDCPLCGKLLRYEHSDKSEPIHTISCATSVVSRARLKDIKSAWHRDELSSHFAVEYQNYKPVYQVIKVVPYIIKGYDNCFNIYKYDQQLISHFVVEVPTFDIPWNNQEALIKKLSTYSLFS